MTSLEAVMQLVPLLREGTFRIVVSFCRVPVGAAQSEEYAQVKLIPLSLVALTYSHAYHALQVGELTFSQQDLKRKINIVTYDDDESDSPEVYQQIKGIKKGGLNIVLILNTNPKTLSNGYKKIG